MKCIEYFFQQHLGQDFHCYIAVFNIIVLLKNNVIKIDQNIKHQTKSSI